MMAMYHAKRIRAKHTGTCRDCGSAIKPGDSIWWQRGQGARHVDCETARLRESGCPACSGRGCAWNNRPCRSCDGTGSRTVYEFAKSGGHPRKPGYEPMSPYGDGGKAVS